MKFGHKLKSSAVRNNEGLHNIKHAVVVMGRGWGTGWTLTRPPGLRAHA